MESATRGKASIEASSVSPEFPDTGDCEGSKRQAERQAEREEGHFTGPGARCSFCS